MNGKSITIGGMHLVGVSAEDEEFLRARGRFAEQYCAAKGWDMEKLEMNQLLEIRSQEGWKNPVKEGKG